MTAPAVSPDSYYQRTGEHRYKPTAHAGGAWNTEEQHFSPLAGLVVHAVDRFLAERPATGLALARISYDILGRIALDECEITVESIRPGRTVELLEAVVVIGDRPVVRARAWLLAVLDTAAVEDSPVERLAPPEDFAPWAMGDLWDGGYISSIEVRHREAARAGRATAWISTGLGLVAGEPSSPLASFVALVDTANGIAVQQQPTAWMYPNTDLTIHLHRSPEGPWTGLDTTVSFGPTGHGLTSTVLHDSTGPVGHASQILTVRPLANG
ncbi:thioesterase family protein [Kitasatospora sp. DSM 101779]|uniref:thioesterase family protein n=1 Tax=Kitasatospora sp. DSM 101779 TaxID=2853165 RepID=UPI0021DB17A0|nr:thioesterase family protein [Kitasatospora sp. DSM 101779]MCU7826664.1 thioesterase family protein [Kitasatospora sp. DSM 101779]